MNYIGTMQIFKKLIIIVNCKSCHPLGFLPYCMTAFLQSIKQPFKSIQCLLLHLFFSMSLRYNIDYIFIL